MAQKVAEYKGGTGGETASIRSIFGEPLNVETIIDPLTLMLNENEKKKKTSKPTSKWESIYKKNKYSDNNCVSVRLFYYKNDGVPADVHKRIFIEDNFY